MHEDTETATTTATELVTGDGTSTGVVIYTSGQAEQSDYWMIGVRPATPSVILPSRLRSFQPPDGPPRWATPLATLAWIATEATRYSSVGTRT